MSEPTFSEQAWEEYIYWQGQDKKTLKRINTLLKDIQREPFSGIGKPELMKRNGGIWSRQIDDSNRLLYKYENGKIYIVQLKGHYDDK